MRSRPFQTSSLVFDTPEEYQSQMVNWMRAESKRRRSKDYIELFARWMGHCGCSSVEMEEWKSKAIQDKARILRKMGVIRGELIEEPLRAVSKSPWRKQNNPSVKKRKRTRKSETIAQEAVEAIALVLRKQANAVSRDPPLKWKKEWGANPGRGPVRSSACRPTRRR